MGRGGRIGLKRSSSQHVCVKSKDSEDSDEDYVAEVEEVDELSDDLESLVGDSSEDESFFGQKEEEEEKGDEGEEEWRTIVKSRAKKSSRSAENGINRAEKRRKVACEIDEEFVNDDDEFTSDEEFSPDEIDSLEEEDFSLPKKKTKKRGRTNVKRKSSARKLRGKTSAKAVKRPVKKKRKKTRSFRREAQPDSEEECTERGPTLRSRSRSFPANKKKRAMVVSDSDSFEPSDYDFTISEEEREQVREANEICRSLETNLRSSRKVLEEVTVHCEPRKTPVRKGKEKAEATKNDVGKPICGICLTEQGKNTVRGTLNCCSHHFCFPCIMEWSKVESRCPLCKQRFVTISKPAKCVKGFALRNVVIQVPERDQVYQPSEEELRDFLNPYENVICTECHLGGDDDLMLLCDLCDSPAHTYCVGLGREVPPGNWYCNGCRPDAFGLSHSQTLELTPDQRAFGDASNGAVTYENMADIDLNVTIPETPLSQGSGLLSPPRYSGASFQSPTQASGTGGASTVFGRRRIHLQMHRLFHNRWSQMPLGVDLNTMHSILRAGVNSTFQHNEVTDVGTSHNAHHVNRLEENPHNNLENRVSIPGRLSDIVGPIGQTLTFADGSAHSYTQWSGQDRMNLGVSQPSLMLSNEQLRPCTSRSSLEPEFIIAPSSNQNEDHTDMVKREVHSIVKRQLKSMSQHMSLGHDTCAEISRRSADTIMVAYGLEPQKHDTHELRHPFCLHVERLTGVEMSPINSCCLTCFENFAKDVVKRMMDITLGPHWLQFRH